MNYRLIFCAVLLTCFLFLKLLRYLLSFIHRTFCSMMKLCPHLLHQHFVHFHLIMFIAFCQQIDEIWYRISLLSKSSHFMPIRQCRAVVFFITVLSWSLHLHIHIPCSFSIHNAFALAIVFGVTRDAETYHSVNVFMFSFYSLFHSFIMMFTCAYKASPQKNTFGLSLSLFFKAFSLS